MVEKSFAYKTSIKLFSLLLCVLSFNTYAGNISINSIVGWYAGPCLVSESQLNTAQKIKLMDADAASSYVVTVSPQNSDYHCNPIKLSRKNTGQSETRYFYALNSPYPISMGVAFDAQKEALDNEKVNGVVETCVSAEGVFIYVLSNATRVLWKEYYHLGYDTEPTCKWM